MLLLSSSFRKLQGEFHEVPVTDGYIHREALEFEVTIEVASLGEWYDWYPQELGHLLSDQTGASALPFCFLGEIELRPQHINLEEAILGTLLASVKK